MKKTTNYIIRNITSGLFLVLPVLFILIICGKIAQILLPPTKTLADSIGLRAISVNILLIILLVLACFVSGLLIRARSVRMAKNWLEDNFLMMIPGYEYIHMRLVSTLAEDSSENPEIVLISYDDCLHPAMVIEKNEDGTCVVFIPNAPNLKDGSVVIADSKMMQPLDMTMNELNKCLRGYGKGLLSSQKKSTT